MTRPALAAITGAGVLSPLGDSIIGLGAALRKGKSNVAPDSDFGGAQVSRLRDFDPARYAKVRGMRVYARATQLEICAAQLALNDAGYAEGAIDPLRLGLVTASSFSHLETLIEYDRGLASVGMQRTNPTLMPLGLPSAPGAATALAFSAKAFSITLNDGGASGLAALGLGARAIAEGRAQICLVAGASTLVRELIQSADQANLLCGSEPFRVLDQRSRGSAFGELAAALVLEPYESAHARGRCPIGFVRAQGAAFAPDPSAFSQALTRACRDSMARAGLSPDSIALALAGAGGIAASDREHARALIDALGAAGPRICVGAPKGNLGETLDPSGLLQCIAALHSLSERVAAPIAGLEHPVLPGLRYATGETELPEGAALLTAVSSTGSCTSLIVSASSP